MTIPNVLSVAGSDPSGGAGVQADIKAICANRCYAMAAITALTVQNTNGVRAVSLVPPDFVAEQIRAITDDIRVDAVKIGMIGTAGIAAAVAKALRAGAARNVVLDPVMVAKGGDRLLAREAVGALIRHLLPMAEILTPNLPEAGDLLDRPAAVDRMGMEDHARALLALGPRAVLLKGGHLAGADSPDLLASAQGMVWLEGARTPTRNTHGTGCTLSSALAAQLALTGDPLAAARAAKAYLARAIACADTLSVGHGHGPVHHFHESETR